MSITPNALRSKRKNELKDIASELGLNTRGLRSDLEDRIRIYLESTESTEESKDNIPASSKTMSRRSDRKTSRPSKSRKDTSPPLNGDRPSSDEENQSGSSESEIKQEVAVNATYTSIISEDSDIAEPNHPRSLVDDRAFRVNTVHDSLLRLRKNISNSHTFCKAIICLEFAVFLYCSVKWNYEITSFTIPYTAYESNQSDKDVFVYYVRVPNIFVLLEWHRFWRPLISFIFYLLLLPLGFSYVFNFEPQRHVYSPLAFSVAQYAIFLVSFGIFDWTEDVRDFIPENLIYAGAGAGAIFALYESILTN